MRQKGWINDKPYWLLWSTGAVAVVLGVIAFVLWGLNGAATLSDMIVALCTSMSMNIDAQRRNKHGVFPSRAGRHPGQASPAAPGSGEPGSSNHRPAE
jgi:hypothetical protein